MSTPVAQLSSSVGEGRPVLYPGQYSSSSSSSPLPSPLPALSPGGGGVLVAFAPWPLDSGVAAADVLTETYKIAYNNAAV